MCSSCSYGTAGPVSALLVDIIVKHILLCYMQLMITELTEACFSLMWLEIWLNITKQYSKDFSVDSLLVSYIAG